MNKNSKVHLPSLAMLLLSGGGAGLAGSSAAGLSLAGVIIWLGEKSSGNGAQIFFSFAWTAALLFFLLIPSAIFAGFRLMGNTVPVWSFDKAYLYSLSSLVFVPVLIGLGTLIIKNQRLAELLLPLFQLAVVGLPLVWLILMGTRGFSSGSSQWDWGIFSFSTIVSIPIILIIETMVIVIIGAGAVIWLKISSPDILQQFGNTLQRLVNSERDTEAIFRILRPYLSNPMVLVGGLAITSGIVPMLEELLKPMALWFFAPRPLTVRAGFIGGLICGASFALLESLGALSNPSPDAWPLVAFGRIGTGILHTATSGLVGWGLGSAWSEGKYGRLAAAYFAAICFHGLWNIFGLLTGLSSITTMMGVKSETLDIFIQISPLVLIILSGLLISIIRRANIILHSNI
jgi:hypothetical protein